MNDYIENTERIIGEIVKIEKVERGELKKLIIELADHLRQGIESKRPEVIAKLKAILAKDTQRPRGQDEIKISMISLLIKKIKADNFPSLSTNWVEMCLPAEYKEHREEREVKKKMILPEDIDDGNLMQISKELTKRIRKMNNLGPAKEIKIKETEEELNAYDYKCAMARELVKLGIKMENEHEHDHKEDYCKKSADHIRMARDKRYATTFSRYHAIVVMAEHSRSLANLAGDEVEVLSRWEVADNENSCRECLDLNSCRATKCNHGCHDFKKKMTTKGINWAMRETQELNELQKNMQRLQRDSDDMCEMMKMVFINPKLKMTEGQKKTIMAKHMEIDKCDQCVYFEMEHPDFFKSHLQ